MTWIGRKVSYVYTSYYNSQMPKFKWNAQIILRNLPIAAMIVIRIRAMGDMAMA